MSTFETFILIKLIAGHKYICKFRLDGALVGALITAEPNQTINSKDVEFLYDITEMGLADVISSYEDFVRYITYENGQK